MQELNAASVNARGMLLNLRKRRWDFSKRSDRNEVRERVDQDKPVMIIGPEVYSALGEHSSSEETKIRSKAHQDL